MRFTSIIASFLLLISFTQVGAQLTEKQIDQITQESLKTFDVPGISVGVIEDGKVVYAKGHGVRSLTNKKPMNESTLVGIASNSKGFTCVALAMLVDEGKLNWDDKVKKYIPEFDLKDKFAANEFTVRDLVTHRSGLSLGAGDLMFFPEGNNYTIADVINGVAQQEPESSFRSKFQYNNNMYNIAGEVLHRISGMTWAEFIEKRILEPVGMHSSKASYNRVTNRSNIIDAHAPVNGVVTQIPHDWSELANPAGGIMSNITDMLVWANFLMNNGVTQEGKRLISEDQMHELWTLQTPIPVAKNHPYDTHFYGYGLGWFLSDVGGTLEVTHSGGLLGTVTKFTLLPEKNVGIVVLTNQQSGAAFMAINNEIKDSYLGYEDRNWVKKYDERMDNYHQKVTKEKADVEAQTLAFEDGKCEIDPANIIGAYQDAWLGDIYIDQKGKKLRIQMKNQPQLKGELFPYNEHTYVAKWDNRSFDADAFLLFSFDENGKSTGFTMKPISSITDFSFDFVDLKVKRVEEKSE